MSSSTLERLLATLFAPILTAAPKKKKAVKSAIKRKSVKPVRPAKSARPKKAKPAVRTQKSEKRSPKKLARDKKKGKTPNLPAQPAVVAKAEAVEPAPKPVAPTGRAILIAPENDKFTASLHPIFRWLSVGGANRYEVAWSETPDFTHPYSTISFKTEATVPVEKPLHIGATYTWRVRGGNEGGWGPWSSSATFRVLEGEE